MQASFEAWNWQGANLFEVGTSSHAPSHWETKQLGTTETWIH